MGRQINKIIPGYIIQVFDTGEGRYVSQEFYRNSEAIEYEFTEDGEFTDNSWTEFVPELPMTLEQPRDDEPPILPDRQTTRIVWTRWYRSITPGMGLKAALQEYERRADIALKTPRG